MFPYRRVQKTHVYAIILVLQLIGIFILLRANKLNIYAQLLRLSFSSKATALCKNCNVLLVTIDSCAAQHIPCYGYDRNTMPNFCKLSSENILFNNMFANAPWTLPSHVTLFTGLFPSNHRVNNVFTDPLSPDIPLLSDIFHSNGYETLFYMPEHNEILSDTIIYNRGMTELIDNVGMEDEGIDAALSRLQKNSKDGKKTFLSLYSQQCHYPYLLHGEKAKFTNDLLPEVPTETSFAPIPFTEGFYRNLLQTSYVNMNKSKEIEGGSYAFYRLIYDTLHNAGTYSKARERIDTMMKQADFNIDLYRAQYFEYYYALVADPKDKREMSYLRALYDQMLYRLDQGIISKIATAFTQTALKNNTILIITSEHGDAFGEHDTYGHTTLYDENLRVPLMMHIPNVKGRTVDDSVQSADITPTLLELVGIPHSFHFDGMSLVSVLSGKRLPERLIVADNYLTPRFSKTIRSGDWKLFVSSVDNYIPYMLFNITIDPQEKIDVLGSNISVANALLDSYKKTHVRTKN